MSKPLICAALLFFISATGKSQSTIIADITNFRNDKGVCRACLFNNPASFDGETGQPCQCVAVPVKNQIAEAIFNNVPAGTYAIFIFHDANSNHKMDKNFIGIPREGYGASNNKLPFAGAPTFNGNKFIASNNTTVTLQIRLRNL